MKVQISGRHCSFLATTSPRWIYIFAPNLIMFYKNISIIVGYNNNNNNNNNNVYFKSLSYTNVLFKLEMNAQQKKYFELLDE